MRYDNEKLQDALAAEFVLGTLTGAARRRYQKLEAQMPAMARRRRSWERRLAPMASSLTPVEPPSRVWRRVQTSIDASTGVESRGWFGSVALWRGLTAALSVALVALAGALVTIQPPSPEELYVAVLGEAATKPQWLVSANLDAGQVTVRALVDIDVATDKAYELWMLPGGGAEPVSLGLLPVQDELVLNLDAAAAGVLRNSGALAVSLEPAGGSPLSVPTGPVVYVAALIRS